MQLLTTPLVQICYVCCESRSSTLAQALSACRLQVSVLTIRNVLFSHSSADPVLSVPSLGHTSYHSPSGRPLQWAYNSILRSGRVAIVQACFQHYCQSLCGAGQRSWPC